MNMMICTMHASNVGTITETCVFVWWWCEYTAKYSNIVMQSVSEFAAIQLITAKSLIICLCFAQTLRQSSLNSTHKKNRFFFSPAQMYWHNLTGKKLVRLNSFRVRLSPSWRTVYKLYNSRIWKVWRTYHMQFCA